MFSELDWSGLLQLCATCIQDTSEELVTSANAGSWVLLGAAGTVMVFLLGIRFFFLRN